MERGFERSLIEEHVTKGGTCKSDDEGLLMDTEEVGVGAFEPQTARIVLDIMDETVYLLYSMDNTLMVIGRIRIPDATNSRKYTRKLFDSIGCL